MIQVSRGTISAGRIFVVPSTLICMSRVTSPIFIETFPGTRFHSSTIKAILYSPNVLGTFHLISPVTRFRSNLGLFPPGSLIIGSGMVLPPKEMSLGYLYPVTGPGIGFDDKDVFRKGVTSR